MADIWEKRFIHSGGMRVVLAFVYLLTIIVLPLSHTCRSGKNVCSICTEHIQHQRDPGCHAGEQPTVAFKQNGLFEIDESQNRLCQACLYSLTSKTYKPCSTTSLCSIQTAARARVLPPLSRLSIQLEWLCSVPLRAPPINAS